MYEDSNFSTFLLVLVNFSFFFFFNSHPVGVSWFYLYFPNEQWWWASSRVLLNSPCISSSSKNATSHNNASRYTVKDGFLEHSPSRGSLYYNEPALQKIIPFFLVPPRIFWIRVLYQVMCFANVFLPAWVSLFILFESFEEKFLTFKTTIHKFFPKNSLPSSRVQKFSPMFSSGSFIVLGFTLRSMIHFDLILT